MLRLLVALDFSDCSRDALRSALLIAQHTSPTELVLITVLDALADDEAQAERALNELETAVSGLHQMVESTIKETSHGKHPPGAKLHFTAVRGAPADQIIEQARAHHVDAIVMGTHGRTGLNRLLTGSVAEMVVRQAPCSVLTVKPKKTG
jgi:nucleotide-binding universal stress UspA family protein